MPDHTPQDLVSQLRMDGVVRFRDYGDCLYLEDQDVLKLYRPKSVRQIGGQPGDRVQMGDIGFLLRAELCPLPSRRLPERPPSMSMIPIMKLPLLVQHGAMIGGQISSEFAAALHGYLHALPNTERQVEECFGANFLRKSSFERSELVIYLRSVTVFTPDRVHQ